MSTASGVSWAACPPGPRAWPSDGWQEWPPPVGGGQAAASGPLPSRAPARLYREGHTEGHSPGRGRKKPPGWVWAIKGHCFVLQGEQRPGTSMSCPPDLCSLASSRAYLPRCPCLPVILSPVHSLRASTRAASCSLCPDARSHFKTYPRHIHLSTPQWFRGPPTCTSTAPCLPSRQIVIVVKTMAV